MSGYLYRAYDAAGRLLYVGQTAQPLVRVDEHRRGSEWARDVAEWRIVPCSGDVIAAEAEAIFAEQPLHNVRHADRGFSTRYVPVLTHDPAAIRRALRASGLTQRGLAEAIGKGDSLVSEILKGTRNATPAVLLRIADVLSVDAEGLLAEVRAA